MAYDVFVIASSADADMAKLVVRRLRALKMRVYYDAKNEDDRFTSRESAKLERSKSALVLWSDNGVKSDEVRAAASQAYSQKDQPLVQVTVDGTTPYDPFMAMPLHSLKGFTSRTTTEGWYGTVEALEAPLGRKDLRAWMMLGNTDKTGQAAWKKSHPKDPLSQVSKPVGAAAKSAGKAAGTTAKAAAGAGAASLAAAPAGGAAKPPPAPKPGPATVSGRPVPPAAATAETEGGPGFGIIAWILAGIALMLFLAWLWRTPYQAKSPYPAVANASLSARVCPAGQMPKSMLNILESGTIIDDTGE